MDSRQTPAGRNIFSSFRLLKGNTRTSVVFEPLWGIPFVLFNFYLSLYMKELGVTDREIGYLISIGFIAGTVFSLLGGVITDRLGRKRTTFIFDFVSWPITMVIYFFSHNFYWFAAATIVNNIGKIVQVSWSLMVVEDASNEERVAAFNLLSIINIATGVLIPVGGIFVSAFGIVSSEKIFLLYAAISMSVMIFGRNHFYRETKVGRRILEEHKKISAKTSLKSILPLKAASVFVKSPAAVIVVLIYIIYNIYIPLGTINSLYFAPYMTEALKLDKSFISILGGVYSAVLFVIFVVVTPYISSRFKGTANMIAGLAVQAASMLLLVLIPTGSMPAAVFSIVVFAVGFGVFKPFIDALLAEVTDERERAGIYAIIYSVSCVATALVAFVSGSLYSLNPKSIYIVSLVVLAACIVLLAAYGRMPHTPHIEEAPHGQDDAGISSTCSKADNF